MKFAIVRTIELKFYTWIKWLPATVPMQEDPSGTGKGAAIPFYADKWRFIDQINDERGYNYARSIGKNWINTAYDVDTPYSTGKVESIIDAGNYISYDTEQNNHVQVRAFAEDESLMVEFNPTLINWRSRPYLFQKATSTNYTLKLHNVGSDIDSFIPLVRRTDSGGTGELWLPISKIEKFAELPFVCSIDTKVTTRLRIRASWSTNSALIGYYQAGDKFEILAYRLVGVSIWGQTNLGWVCLLLAEYPGQRVFTTNWRLKSPGVVSPSVII